MIFICSCHHLIIWGLILILFLNLFLLLTHTSTFMVFFHLPGWKNPIIYYFFHWPILVVFSGEEGLLFLKDHNTITAGVSWALVKSLFYHLFIVAPNQFLPLPSSENPWVFICKDFDLAILFAWIKNSCQWTESFRKWVWKGHILNKFRFYLGRIF